MKIKLSLEEDKKIRGLFLQKEENMKAAEAINTYLESEDERSSKASKYLFYDLGEEASYAFSTVFRKLAKPDGSLIESYHLDEGQPIDPKPYLNDPYSKLIHFHNEKHGDWELINDSYRPFEGFVSNELTIIRDGNYKEITPLGYFKQSFPFLEVRQKGTTWMSVTPHEINTMKGAIEKAHGKVLTFGLGLGYFALLASLKKEVGQVTVVELDPTIIELFKRYILPQFPFKEKIRVIQDDAFRFAKKLHDEEYDFIFDDIWHLPTDGLYLYLKMKKCLPEFKKTELVSWVEPSLLSLLRRAVLILLEEEMNGSTDLDYDYAASESDLLINSLHRLLKKKEVASYNDALELVSDENLKTLKP